MKPSAIFVLLSIVFSLCAWAQTDAVILANGDRLTGTIEKWQDNNLVFKGDNTGAVKIPWNQVKGLESKRTLYFRMSEGVIQEARAGGSENGQLLLLLADGKRLVVPAESVQMVGTSPEAFAPAKEEAKEPKLWSGFIDLSFSGNEGNKNDRTLVGIGHLERKTETDLFTAHIDIQHSTARRERVKQQVQGYLREAMDITPRFYGFAQASGEWDEITHIKLRLRLEAGLGVHLLKEGDFELFKGDKVTFKWEVGGHFTSTDYRDAEDIQTGGFVTRVIYCHIFPNEWKLELLGEYYQSLKRPADERDTLDDYTLKGRASLVIPVNGFISFSAAIWDEYNNYVLGDLKRNDFYWTLGLRVNF